MSRRKQARPQKRLADEDESETSELIPEKSIRLEEPSTSTVKVPTTSALTLLENSLKKFEPTRPSARGGTSPTPTSGSLGALFNCIGKINSVPAPEPEGVSSILKCLQCGLCFPVMEQLVKHMQETKHFSNLPKPYTNLMQLDRQKLFSMKADPVKLACLKCGEVPANMDQHLKEVHSIKKKADWLRNVQVISGLTPPALQSPQLKQLMSLINTVAKQ